MIDRMESEGKRLTQLWQIIQTAVWNLIHRPGWTDIFDIIIVTVAIYFLLKIVSKTRGGAVLKGAFMFFVVTFFSDLLGFTALHWIMMSVINNGALVLIILFQPELRTVLENIGRGSLVKRHSRAANVERERIMSEIIQCAQNLSRRKVGALIVFERKTGLQDIVETGTEVDGRISAPLLENIFEPNTPLHDGAVIIRGDRVVAGACILTLTENRGVSRDLGTRHRAGLGVSETTDAVVLIISEETGIISVAQEGKLTRHMDANSLREVLSTVFGEPQTALKPISIKRRKKEERAQ